MHSKSEFFKKKSSIGEPVSKPKIKVTFQTNKIQNNLFRLTELQFQNNCLLIVNIINLLEQAKLASAEKEFNKSIINIYDLLMQIPYKYGRVNLSKRMLGKTNENRFVTLIGLPYVVKLLQENPDFILPENIKKEIVTILPILFKTFLIHQSREEYIDDDGNVVNYSKKLSLEIKELQQEIHNIEALNYTPEQKQKLAIAISENGNAIKNMTQEMLQLEHDLAPPSPLKRKIHKFEEIFQSENRKKEKTTSLVEILSPSELLSQEILNQEESYQESLLVILQLEIDCKSTSPMDSETTDKLIVENESRIKLLFNQFNHDNFNLEVARKSKAISSEERQKRNQKIEKCVIEIENIKATITDLVKINISLHASRKFAGFIPSELEKLRLELADVFNKRIEENYQNNLDEILKLTNTLAYIESEISDVQGKDVPLDQEKSKNIKIKELIHKKNEVEIKIALFKKHNSQLTFRINNAHLSTEEKKEKIARLKIDIDFLEKESIALTELRDIAQQPDSTIIGIKYKTLVSELDKNIEDFKQLNNENEKLVLAISKRKILIAQKNSMDTCNIDYILTELKDAKIAGNRLSKILEKSAKSTPSKVLSSIEQEEKERVLERLKQAKIKAEIFTEDQQLVQLESSLRRMILIKEELNRKIQEQLEQKAIIEQEMDMHERFEREKESQLKKLPELKERLEEKKEKYRTLSMSVDEEYRFTELDAFQNEYDKRHVYMMIRNFKRNLLIADTNVSIILAIVNFVNWQKEYCGELMANKIESILTTKCTKDFRDFRHQAMHGLDDMVALAKITDIKTSAALKKELKPLLIAMFECLLSEKNKDFLADNVKEPGEVFTSGSLALDKIRTYLPPLVSHKEEDGQDRALQDNEQLRLLISSVCNSKIIIELINTQLNSDQPSFPLSMITKIMGTPDNQLDEEQLAIKLKYDALLQSLGQAIGNLQQYTQLTITSLVSVSLEEVNNDFNELNEFVPIIKDFRSGRTHNGYYNIPSFQSALTTITSFKEALLLQLDNYLITVKEQTLLSGNLDGLEQNDEYAMVESATVCNMQ